MVGPMTPTDFQEIVGEERKARFSEAAMKWIFELSGGHPYVAQCLIYLALNQKESKQITPDVIESTVPDATENLSPLFIEQFEALTNEEREILIALIEYAKPISFGTVASSLGVRSSEAKTALTNHLKLLVVRGVVLESPEKKYSILVKLFARFLQRSIQREAKRRRNSAPVASRALTRSKKNWTGITWDSRYGGHRAFFSFCPSRFRNRSST
jgi:hypothetical protein